MALLSAPFKCKFFNENYPIEPNKLPYMYHVYWFWLLSLTLFDIFSNVWEITTYVHHIKCPLRQILSLPLSAIFTQYISWENLSSGTNALWCNVWILFLLISNTSDQNIIRFIRALSYINVYNFFCVWDKCVIYSLWGYWKKLVWKLLLLFGNVV